METDPLNNMLDLASERARGRVLAASDDFFAEKENLIKLADPIFIADKYTDRGKWMDGWESRRKRAPGHDWVVLRLGIPGIIRRVTVDTRYFTGNFPEHCSLEVCTAPRNAPPEELGNWIELIPKSPLLGDALNIFEVPHPQRFTHVRLNIFPDGGVARLRIHGEACPDWRTRGSEIDLAAAENGATVADASNRHYGNPMNMLMPGRGRNMGDGWETRRRRGSGHDWAVVRLAAEGVIERVEIDTAFFKGNYPDSCSLESSATGEEGSWIEVLGQTKLQADSIHLFEKELHEAPSARFARLRIYPDGGVSRLHLFGRLSEQGRIDTRLAALNSDPQDQAAAAFLRCCGSTAWAKAMAAGRPYVNLTALEDAADEHWFHCTTRDVLEAFSAHPQIGQKIGQKSGTAWSHQEQSAASTADAATRQELETLNLLYLQKFGYIFIVCATGKSMEEIAYILRGRIENDPEEEIFNAGEEQRLITHLRLRKLLSE